MDKNMESPGLYAQQCGRMKRERIALPCITYIDEINHFIEPNRLQMRPRRVAIRSTPTRSPDHGIPPYRGGREYPVSARAHALHGISRGVKSFKRAYSTATKKVYRDWLYEGAKPGYLKHHARLSGSTRTKRLRKKRSDAVINWYYKNFRLESIR